MSMTAMARFTVRYFDAERGAVVEEITAADSEQVLRAQVDGRGGVVLEMRRVASAPRRALGGAFDVGTWSRELRTLLVAGMTVVEALETLHAQAAVGSRRDVLAALLGSLHQGKSLSYAMWAAGVFPQVLIASVTASERTSTLPTALEDYLAYDELLARLRRQVVSAAVYPLVVVALGGLVTLFLLLYVIPRFSRMYVDFKGAVSLPTQLLLFFSDLLHRHSMLLLLGACAVAAVIVWAWRSGHLQSAGSRIVEVVGPLRRGREQFIRAKLYQSLALMFRGGYPLDESLAVCAGLGLGRGAERGIATAQSTIARGGAVSSAFAEGGLADPVAQRLLAVGERSGNFDTVLRVIADRHAQAFATFVERATRLVEPLLLLLVALVVGGIVVMMYMPIFDIASGIR